MMLNSDMFCFGDHLLDSATEIKLWLSSNTLQKTSGFEICISKIKDTSYVNAIKVITLSITCLNAILPFCVT